MAIDVTKTEYGYVLSCTGGTAVTATVVHEDQPFSVIGVHFAGAATSDIITLYNGNGTFFMKGYGGTGLSNHNFTFPKPVRLQGLQASAAGATTGTCVLYLA